MDEAHVNKRAINKPETNVSGLFAYGSISDQSQIGKYDLGISEHHAKNVEVVADGILAQGQIEGLYGLVIEIGRLVGHFQLTFILGKIGNSDLDIGITVDGNVLARFLILDNTREGEAIEGQVSGERHRGKQGGIEAAIVRDKIHTEVAGAVGR